MLVELPISERFLPTPGGEHLPSDDPISEYFGGFPAGNGALRLDFGESTNPCRGLLKDAVVVDVVLLVVFTRFPSATVVVSSVRPAPVDETLS